MDLMNPFDLRGPQFLLFYAVFGAVVTLALVQLRRRADSADQPMHGSPRLLTNYLDIAFLRGGEQEALRVATLGLVERGLLEVVDGDRLRTRDPTSIERTPEATERQVLRTFTEPRAAGAVLSDRSLRTIVSAACEPTLTRLGLLPGPGTHATRRTLFLWAALILLGTAAVKIALALSRGRTNILFLILLAIAFLVVTYLVTHPRRTSAGDAMLRDLEGLFSGLRQRPAAAQAVSGGGGIDDLSLLAAVYGLSAVHDTMPEARRLFPTSSGSGGAESSSSSSCGSSSGGSSCGGSSCGGGGGCGGCGGGS